ncbi:MAG: AMIN domain-containing protein, partial [Deltaproteobacteria bacterium]
MSNDSKEKRTLLRLFSMGFVLFLLGCSGCALTPKEVAQIPESASPKVEAISVQSVNADETRVEIVGSQPLSYTDFSLTDPPRVIVDVVGLLGPDVPTKQAVSDGNVKEISLLEETSNKNATRMLVSLARTMDYTITKEGNALIMSLHSPKLSKSEEPLTSSESEKPAQPEITSADNQTPSNPRIFFKPGSKQQVQILGVDFAMLNGGKSRLTVTTSSKGAYELNRVGPKAIRLNLENATIPPLLMRRLDTTYFEGAIDRVKANFLPEKKQVTLDLTMREMVPFHVDQTDTALLV